MEIKDIFFYINLHLKNRLDIEFKNCLGELVPEEALTHHLPYLTHIANLRVRQSY